MTTIIKNEVCYKRIKSHYRTKSYSPRVW